MNVMCSDVRALEACLVGCQRTLLQIVPHLSRYSQPSANVNIAAWDLGSSEEGMAAVTSGSCNLDRVTPTVRLCGIE
jgi:hypothetical protein